MDYLIIGAGQFGASLTKKLTEYGHEVLLIDKDDQKISSFVDIATRTLVGDCSDIETIQELGVEDFDACFVCTSNDFQSSLEITSNLKDAGASRVVAKVEHKSHANLLKKIGADEVVYPERDMATRLALHYARQGIFSNYELMDNISLVEIKIPEPWIQKSLRELDVRQKYNVTIIGFTKDAKFIAMIDPDVPLKDDVRLLVLGDNEDILALP